MPKLSDHQSREFTKLLVTGDSKAGKTGALVSLVKAGYKLRILDYDNGLDVLKQFVMKECPAHVDNVEFRTLRDDRVPGPDGPIIKGLPKAFADGLKMLDRWKYGDVDLGSPGLWGADHILVLDSLTFFSDAAFDYREAIAAKTSSKYDRRAVYKDAQDAVEHVLALLTSGSFKTNVIVISHIKYMENADEGTTKGYPVSVGSALSPVIPRYFNNYVRFVTKGGKRTIQTSTSAMFDLATARPFDMPKEFQVEDGLAKIFELLRK